MERENIREEKRRIRRETAEIRGRMTTEERQAASRRITEQVLALPAFRKARTVMAYVSMEGEPDTGEILKAVLREGKRLLLPRCLENHRMAAVPVTNLQDLRPGRWGIPEPEMPAEGTEIPEPDLILVPCVAATERGTRLGHGGGYYDRFLAEHPGERAALCFRACLREELPAEETDLKMDRVIHEEGLTGRGQSE